MPQNDISLEPVDRITVDALGKPGSRIFYIQGSKGDQVVSLIIEKIQLQSLTIGIGEFLKEISERFPHLTKPEGIVEEPAMTITPPLDPLFRVGDIGLAYDDERELVCIIAKEMQVDGSEVEGGVVRYWCTRNQLVVLSRWGKIVIERGRPICPQCQEPMEPEGHFCPKKNGHKRGKKPPD
jgi:uncharacterized repeat protein (TIGR03847 family)